MKKKIIVLATAIGLLSATPAFASHDHYLQTPGTCIEGIAHGQTSIDKGEGGYHQFHEQVHLGTPGKVAFQKTGKVFVDKVNICEAE